MSLRKLLPSKKKQYASHGPKCSVVDMLVRDLSDYFSLFKSLLTDDCPFWFRGHSRFTYTPTPSALRHGTEATRTLAISLIADFRRFAEIKLARPPEPNDDLKWVQLAQHYGLDTRLLDWTENAAVALYFACQREDEDGAVLVLNPVDLNRLVDAKRPRVFDAQVDCDIIAPYLKMTGRINRGGKRTIAIHPVLNSERIVLQKGVFTLHGEREFALNNRQASSLVQLPILSKYKAALLRELDRVGISEMALFPELEHLCNHLKRKAQL